MSQYALKQEEINTKYQALFKNNGLLPIKVTEFYQRKVAEEVSYLGHTEGPLHRIVYPSYDRLFLKAPNEVDDFAGDKTNSLDKEELFIIRKYKERLLFLATDQCAGNCQFCFRHNILTENNCINEERLSYKVCVLEKYLKSNKEIKEVILSGGDPMCLSYEYLKEIISCLKNVCDIESIRIHSRALVYSPEVFTMEKIKLLGEAKVRLYLHIAHPYEICKTVEEYIHIFNKSGIRLYNQFAMLRNINDHCTVLIELMKKIDQLQIRNASIFIPDPIFFSAAFRINLKRVSKIFEELNWTSPSWINSTRLVLDTVHGKVRLENIIEYDTNSNIAIFEREGEKIMYHDFPKEMDQPGKLETMLWKG